MENLPGEIRPFYAQDSFVWKAEKLLDNMIVPREPRELTLKPGVQVMSIKNLDGNLVNGMLEKVVGFCYCTGAMVDSDWKTGKTAGSKAEEPTAWTLVEFNLVNGIKQQLVCKPREWTVELPNGKVQASRKQVPLILAWALYIYKAQGETLARLRVDLARESGLCGD